VCVRMNPRECLYGCVCVLIDKCACVCVCVCVCVYLIQAVCHVLFQEVPEGDCYEDLPECYVPNREFPNAV
jgi:hypothetical protein